MFNRYVCCRASARCKGFIKLVFVSMVTVAYFIRVINICNIYLAAVSYDAGHLIADKILVFKFYNNVKIFSVMM